MKYILQCAQKRKKEREKKHTRKASKKIGGKKETNQIKSARDNIGQGTRSVLGRTRSIDIEQMFGKVSPPNGIRSDREVVGILV